MKTLYGLAAEFALPEHLLSATREAFSKGYRHMDTYTPYPIEGLDEALGLGAKDGGVAAITLLGGILGGTGAYFMQWWANVIGYPVNIGGRPNHSWPAFIPITFELTVLSAGLSAVLIGVLALCRLPKLYHPIFNTPHFEHASQDAFFLCIEATDPNFKRTDTESFLREMGAKAVHEVPNDL